MRFGPQYKNVSANVVVSGALINWVTSSRYLGVYLVFTVLIFTVA